MSDLEQGETRGIPELEAELTALRQRVAGLEVADGGEEDDWLPEEERLEARLAKAEAERDEARVEAAQWEGSFKGMVAVERELKADLAKAVEGLRRIAEKCEGDLRNQEPREVAKLCRSILAEIEEDDDG